jgi:hypothetical protein
MKDIFSISRRIFISVITKEWHFNDRIEQFRGIQESARVL